MKKGIIEFDPLEIISLGTMYQVSQQTAVVVERFGKFVRIGKAGLNFKIPLVDQLIFTQTLRVQQLDVRVSTKTKDNVFLEIVASVQYRVSNEDEKIKNSYYELEDVAAQINSYVFDVVRAEIPKMVLDEVFEKKDDIALTVKNELADSIRSFGFEIVKTLVTDINVDKRIIQAMNEIVASEREKTAAIQKAEANKIMIIAAAQAEAESKKLQGEGIANQRKAIISGLRESVDGFREGTGVDTETVMNLVLVTQYFDTLKEVSHGQSNTILLPHSPAGMSDFVNQMRDAIIAGNIASK